MLVGVFSLKRPLASFLCVSVYNFFNSEHQNSNVDISLFFENCLMAFGVVEFKFLEVIMVLAVFDLVSSDLGESHRISSRLKPIYGFVFDVWSSCLRYLLVSFGFSADINSWKAEPSKSSTASRSLFEFSTNHTSSQNGVLYGTHISVIYPFIQRLSPLNLSIHDWVRSDGMWKVELLKRLADVFWASFELSANLCSSHHGICWWAYFSVIYPFVQRLSSMISCSARVVKAELSKRLEKRLHGSILFNVCWETLHSRYGARGVDCRACAVVSDFVLN